MRVFKYMFMAAAVLCLSAGLVFAQAAGQGQYRTYPGGNIAYYNPGQVYPPPGVPSSPPGVVPYGSAGGVQGSVLPPAPMASAGGYQPPAAVSQQASSASSSPASSSAPQFNNPPADPQSGSFRPGVSLGPPNPYTHYIGDSEWKHFAQRTASFGGPPVYSAPAPSPVTKAKPKAKAKHKPKAKAKPKPQPVADIPKRPMNDKEREQFCLEYVEICKDYFK